MRGATEEDGVLRNGECNPVIGWTEALAYQGGEALSSLCARLVPESAPRNCAKRPARLVREPNVHLVWVERGFADLQVLEANLSPPFLTGIAPPLLLLSFFPFLLSTLPLSVTLCDFTLLTSFQTHPLF
jgi:hypothetical protein